MGLRPIKIRLQMHGIRNCGVFCQVIQTQNTSGLQMTTLNKILADKSSVKHATDNGTKMHKMLQCVVIDDGTEIGNNNLISQIKKHPGLIHFFNKSAKTEVPIAGTINGRFVSRRIDRLCIDDNKNNLL